MATKAKPASASAGDRQIKRLQIGANVALQILLVAAVVLLANYIAFRRLPSRWDLSRNAKYQLSPMTKNILRELQKPVQAIVFSAGSSPVQDDLASLLREYEYASGKKFTAEYVNPFSNVTRAKQLATQYKLGQNENNVVLDYGGKSKVVSMLDMAELDNSGAMFGQPPTVRSFKGEQIITSTLLELTEEKQSKLYLITGHGEVDANGQNVRGFRAYAERQNVKIDSLNFSSIDTVPADASCIMLFGPKTDYSERDLKLLGDYWAKNGRLFLLLNPDGKTPRLNSWLAEQGIRAKGDYVLRTGSVLARDPESGGIAMRTGVFTSPAGVIAPGNDITKDLGGSDIELLGHTESLEIDPAMSRLQKLNAFPVITSGEGFWGETEFSGDATQGVFFDTKKDRIGPFPLAIAAEKGAVQDVKVDTARLVVVGNASFLTDEGLQLSDVGIDFAVNCLNWSLNREKLVGIAPKPKEPVRLTLDDKKLTRLVIAVFGLIPGLAAFVGVAVWARRRS